MYHEHVICSLNIVFLFLCSSVSFSLSVFVPFSPPTLSLCLPVSLCLYNCMSLCLCHSCPFVSRTLFLCLCNSQSLYVSPCVFLLMSLFPYLFDSFSVSLHVSLSLSISVSVVSASLTLSFHLFLSFSSLSHTYIEYSQAKWYCKNFMLDVGLIFFVSLLI